jgi:hypothetical protein
MFAGCAPEIAHDRILTDAQNEFHRRKQGLKVHEAEVKNYFHETPTIIKAQVEIIGDRPLGSFAPRAQAGNMGRYYYTLNYKKMKSGWELIRVKEGSLTD